jgi:hypothetical protein
VGGLGGRGCRDAREGDLRREVAREDDEEEEEGRLQIARHASPTGAQSHCKLNATLHFHHVQVPTPRLAPRASRLTPHTPHRTPRLHLPRFTAPQITPRLFPWQNLSQRAPKCCCCSCSCSAPRNCSKLHLPALACAHLAVDQSTVPLVRHFVRLRKIHPPFSPQHIRRIVCSLVPYPGPGAAYPSSTPICPTPRVKRLETPSPTGKRAPALSVNGES